MATETVTNYNEDSIKTLEDVVHIRKRPGMYIGRLGDGSNAGDGAGNPGVYTQQK